MNATQLQPDITPPIGDIILKVTGVCKEFPGVRAVSDMDFDLKRGEIHGLVGENGAGKSTFIKMLTGVYKPDQGALTFCGEQLHLGGPLAAQKLGIIAVFQEPHIFRNFSVGENLYVGREKNKVWLDANSEHNEAQKLLESLGFQLNTKQKVGTLSLAEQRMLEIAKAASRQAKILILDEPTASLTGIEIDLLFKVIETLKSKGVAIIYISHRLEEVLRIADRITVLRDGQKVDTVENKGLSEDKLVEMMVGRKLEEMYPKVVVDKGELLFSVKGLTRVPEFQNISFELHRGEILGLAGLVGAGRTELARVLFGVHPPTAGEMYLEGKRINLNGPNDAIRAGFGFVTEDRKNLGLFLNQGVKNNIGILVLSEMLKFGLVRVRSEKKLASDFVRKLRIATPSINSIVKGLSGGNQQKVVLARWLAANVKILILDEPTHGVDVGAKAEIYELLGALVKEGLGIILISSEFQELIAIADRILVMYRGQITGEFARNDANQKNLLKCACGLNVDNDQPGQ